MTTSEQNAAATAHETRMTKIKNEWAVAVDADDMDSLHDWPVERILDLLDACSLLQKCLTSGPQSITSEEIRQIQAAIDEATP